MMLKENANNRLSPQRHCARRRKCSVPSIRMQAEDEQSRRANRRVFWLPHSTLHKTAASSIIFLHVFASPENCCKFIKSEDIETRKENIKLRNCFSFGNHNISVMFRLRISASTVDSSDARQGPKPVFELCLRQTNFFFL